MSLINFVPFMMDEMKPYQPFRLINRDFPHEFSSAISGYEEDDKELRIAVDVPGVKGADLDVTVKDGQVHISGSRRTTSVDGKTTKRFRFAKSFSIDEDALDVSQMKANLEDGVLHLVVPKKPKTEPLKIKVTTEKTNEESISVETEKTAEPKDKEN